MSTIEPVETTKFGGPTWAPDLHAIHFGVYPIKSPNHEDLGPAVQLTPDGEPWDYTGDEVAIPVPEALQSHLKGWVSGSWGCWGPADQETDGDESLHLMFLSDSIEPERVANLHMMVRTFAGDFGRVLDYAVISDPNDWSQQRYVATFGGNPFVTVWEAYRWSASSHDPMPQDDDDEPGTFGCPAHSASGYCEKPGHMEAFDHVEG